MKPELRVYLLRSELVYWLLNHETGRTVGRRWRPREGPVEGIVRRCGFKVVGTYSDPGTSMLHLKVGRRCYPIDKTTRAEHSWALAGLVSLLQVSRDGEPTLRAWDLVPLRRLSRAWTGDYEQTAAPKSDFLMNQAEFVASRHRRGQANDYWASERAGRLAYIGRSRSTKDGTQADEA